MHRLGELGNSPKDFFPPVFVKQTQWEEVCEVVWRRSHNLELPLLQSEQRLLSFFIYQKEVFPASVCRHEEMDH